MSEWGALHNIVCNFIHSRSNRGYRKDIPVSATNSTKDEKNLAAVLEKLEAMPESVRDTMQRMH